MLDQLLAKFSDAHFLAVLFAAIGSAATVLTAGMPWLQPDTLSRRIRRKRWFDPRWVCQCKLLKVLDLSGLWLVARGTSHRKFPQ
jgi:hypothetical protein